MRAATAGVEAAGHGTPAALTDAVLAFALCAFALMAVPSGWQSPPLVEADVPDAPTPPPLVRAAVDSSGPAAPARFALLFDVGVPDGVGLGLRVRPAGPVFVTAGVVSNGVALGVRAGFGILFFRDSFVRPTIAVDGGRMFEGDGSVLMSAFAPQGLGTNALKKVRYDFASAHAGLELGTQRFAVVLRAGASYVDARLDGAVEAFGGSAGMAVEGDPVIVRLFHPSVRVGIVQRF